MNVKTEIPRRDLYLVFNSIILMILILISPNKNLITYLTIIIGTLLVFSIEITLIVEVHDIFKLKNQSIQGIFLVGAILPIFGMYFGNFSAAFNVGIPFGYYIVIAFLVTMQFALVIDIIIGRNSQIKSLDENKEKNGEKSSSLEF